MTKIYATTVGQGTEIQGVLLADDGQPGGWDVLWTCGHRHYKEDIARACAKAEIDRRAPEPTPAELSINDAMDEADIDGYGNEGAGYDFKVFARELEKRGWVFKPKPEKPHVHNPAIYPEAGSLENEIR